MDAPSHDGSAVSGDLQLPAGVLEYAYCKGVVYGPTRTQIGILVCDARLK